MNGLLKSILFVLATAILSLCFSEEKSLSEIFKSAYQQNFTQLLSELDQFEKETNTGKTATIKTKYFDLRSAYKAVEPIYIYFDKGAVKLDINGAPLPRLEANTPGINIIQPKGFQVLDELMGEDEIDIVEVQNQIKHLRQKLKMLNGTLPINQITHRNVIEMYQLNLIKLLTWEQSGFDTPGTLNGVKDAYVTFRSINGILSPCLEPIQRTKPQYEELLALMESGESFLYESSTTKAFNEFDRLTFLRSYIEPIYRKVNEIHTQSGIEYYDEVSKFKLPFNPRADHLFSSDFLQPDCFSGINTSDEKLLKLGKLLFYDPILSGNNKRACASCHNPQKGFTDNLPTSMAMDFKGHLNRNSPTLINAVFASDYFWDLRASKISNQIEHVVFNQDEFGTGFNTIDQKLKQSEEYKKLFAEVFPRMHGEVINKNAVATAITAFVQSLNGWNSEFDHYVRSDSEKLSEDAQKGFNLFMGKAQCGICHFPPSFSGLIPPYFEDSESEVLGMLEKFDTINPVLDDDLGRYASKKIGENAPFYKHAFKTPTVRNAAITFPYMHNGAFKTLDEVIHFYNHGGGVGLGLEVENQTLPESKLKLTVEEMIQLKSFIESLTDTNSIDTSMPNSLPKFGNEWDKRVIGGEY